MTRRLTLSLIMTALLMTLGGGMLSSCLDQNKAEPYVAKTPEEKADIAMREGRFSAAITILEGILEDEDSLATSNPAHYYKHVVLLAAAYAARGGVDLLTLVQNMSGDSGGDSGGGGSGLSATLARFLPEGADPTDLKTDVGQANVLLASVPEDLVVGAPGDVVSWAKSANLQFALYSLAYLAVVFDDILQGGDLTPAVIATLTADQITELVDAIDTAITAAGRVDELASVKTELETAQTALNTPIGP